MMGVERRGSSAGEPICGYEVLEEGKKRTGGPRPWAQRERFTEVLDTLGRESGEGLFVHIHDLLSSGGRFICRNQRRFLAREVASLGDPRMMSLFLAREVLTRESRRWALQGIVWFHRVDTLPLVVAASVTEEMSLSDEE